MGHHVLTLLFTGGGGGAEWLLRVFAKYHENGLANLHKTL